MAILTLSSSSSRVPGMVVRKREHVFDSVIEAYTLLTCEIASFIIS